MCPVEARTARLDSMGSEEGACDKCVAAHFHIFLLSPLFVKGDLYPAMSVQRSSEGGGFLILGYKWLLFVSPAG
jgi:hypothetical protein